MYKYIIGVECGMPQNNKKVAQIVLLYNLYSGCYIHQQTTFIIRSSGHKQKHGFEASRAKIQLMYENLELNLDLKLLFMATGAYYENGLYSIIYTVT